MDYRWDGTRSPSLWVLVEWNRGLQCGVPVEWGREFFSVGYRLNGTEIH